MILGATWEFALVSVPHAGWGGEREYSELTAGGNRTGAFGLANGGTAGAVWIFLVVCFGMFFTMLSMAEMASM